MVGGGKASDKGEEESASILGEKIKSQRKTDVLKSERKYRSCRREENHNSFSFKITEFETPFGIRQIGHEIMGLA